jgi:putative transposase
MCRDYWSMAKVKLRSEFWIETTIVPGGSDLVEGPRRSPTGDAIERDLAMGFVHDQLATGGQPRVLTIVHTFSRVSPALQPRFTFRGVDVVEVVERVRRGGLPATIGLDQGTEFVSCDLDLWTYQCGVALDPGPGRRLIEPSSKSSMDASELNFLTLINSQSLQMPGKNWRIGVSTTTRTPGRPIGHPITLLNCDGPASPPS